MTEFIAHERKAWFIKTYCTISLLCTCWIDWGERDNLENRMQRRVESQDGRKLNHYPAGYIEGYSLIRNLFWLYVTKKPLSYLGHYTFQVGLLWQLALTIIVKEPITFLRRHPLVHTKTIIQFNKCYDGIIKVIQKLEQLILSRKDSQS